MLKVFRLARVFAMVLLLGTSTLAFGDNWPSWRGADGTGVAQGNPPITWSETENVRWKVALPGHGASTPIIWEDKIFILTAVPEDGRRSQHHFKVLCLNRANGNVLWEHTAARAVPHEGHHPTSGFAPFSPVTDGEHLWVSYGSWGLHCYTLDGERVWQAELPKMKTRNGFGEGSSPAIAGDAVIVLADQEGQSEILAFDKRTGKALWRKDRDEPTAWSTPAVAEVNGRLEVITNATNQVRSYDAKTGEVIWTATGQTLNVIPTPVVGDGAVYVTSGFRGSALTAIELGHTGDLMGTDAILWEGERGTPYVPTPLLMNGRLYLLSVNRAVLSCYQVSDGKRIYGAKSMQDVGTIYASPTGAAGKIYLVGRGGGAAVVKAGDEFELLATNQLDDTFDASPVIVDNELFLRGSNNLYCIAE